MEPLRHVTRLALDARVQEIVAVVVLLGATFTALASPGAYELGSFRDSDPLAYALATLAIVPILLRRRFPLAVLGVILAANLVLVSMGYAYGAAPTAILIAMFTVASRCELRVGLAAYGVSVAATFVAIALEHSSLDSPLDYAANAALELVAWLLGVQARERRERIALAEERAERAERERELLAERRVTEERLRIARELHDVIAHSLSAIVVRAGAALTVDGDDARALRRALGMIEETSREALADARGVLGGLRGSVSEDLTPQPGLDRLPDLVEASRQAGIPTELLVTGDERSLAPGAELSIYRVVQEALTNVRKHAGPGARASVQVRYDTGLVEVTVEDDGCGGVGGGTDGGHGLIGMRERASLLGGELEAAPRPEGGFATRLTVPTGTPRG